MDRRNFLGGLIGGVAATATRGVAVEPGAKAFREPARELPLDESADVVVCGGGPAGLAAAVTAALSTYSRLAFGAVVALVATGVLQSVREVGSPVALLTTTYGWLLVAKLAFGLRVGEDAEREGLDITSHGESAYEA